MKHSLTQKTGILAPIMLMMASMMSLPTAVMADQNYVGLLAGKSEVDIKVKSLNGAAYDKTSRASSIFMGREFDDGYSVELFYTNLGSTKCKERRAAAISKRARQSPSIRHCLQTSGSAPMVLRLNIMLICVSAHACQ